MNSCRVIIIDGNAVLYIVDYIVVMCARDVVDSGYRSVGYISDGRRR